MKIYTGSYSNCKSGNLVSISADKGKSAGYDGKYYLKLAPEKTFWRQWKNNIGIISEKENNNFYMENYYEKVLKDLDAEIVYEELQAYGDNIILLCYEESDEFCHRHLAAAWLEYELGININEVVVLLNGEIKVVNEPENLKEDFKEIIKKHKNIKSLVKNK